MPLYHLIATSMHVHVLSHSTYLILDAVPGVEVIDEVCVSLVEQGPDGGRVLSDPARLTLPHAVVEKCTVETRVHMTTQLQLCVCERGEGGGSEKEREERERERFILVSG